MKLLLSLSFFFVSFVFAHTPVAVIDTGVSYSQQKYLCKNGAVSFKGSPYDTHGHGSNIIGIITSQMKEKYCIISYKFYDNSYTSKESVQFVVDALEDAIKRKVKIINMSLFGPVPSVRERKLIKKALDLGITVVISSGNDRKNLDRNCSSYPACYNFKHKNFIVVGSIDGDFGNYGKVVDFYEKGVHQGVPKMSGTSQATANFTKKLVQKQTKEIK